MIDVNKITSTLAKLPDAQLQQYAQMHKNDPYIMALAMSESNRRKAVRSAAPAQQGMQEQPKVVDQMLAEMAPQQMPEEMGIGRLPTGNMNFANGGIIAFAGGGDVERYNGAQTSLVGEAQRILQKPPYTRTPQENAVLEKAGYALQRRTITPDSGVAQADLFLNNLGPKIRNYFTEGASGLSDEALADRPNTGGVMNERLLRSMGVDPTAPRTTPVQSSPVTGAAADAESIRKASASPYVTPAAPTDEAAAMLQRYPKPRTGEAAPKPDTGRKAPAAAPLAGPRTDSAQPQAGLGDLSKLFEDIQKKQDYKDPAAEQLKALEKKELTAAEEAKAALLRDQAKFDDAYKGREKRLTDRESELGKQRDTNVGLAFLNAGLAIMSTPGGLATALGKGAQVGTAQFAAGLDKIRSAQERLDEARDKMEDLKLNRAEMSAKEIRAAEKDIRNVGIDAEKRAIDGIRTAADVNRKTATDLFKATVDVGIGRERIASTEKIATLDRNAANARAAMPTGADRTAMLLGTGKTDAERLESGLRKMQEITADKSGMAAVKVLADINAKLQPGEPRVTMQDLLIGAREFSSLMYGPKVADVAPTRGRP
jgi:hypothetical protein